MKSTWSRRLSILGGLLVLVGPVAKADNMQFYGTLVTPPLCSLNGGRQIDVNFGERVGVNKVDGRNYLQTVNYQLQCEPGASGAVLGLTLIGPRAVFDRAGLQTDREGLAIHMMLGGKPFELSTRVEIDAALPPTLEAVPVKAPGVKLEEGRFEVLATLMADYQ
ncbi:putative minor fimbrial subunit StfF [Serratia quinivorans]|uniref:fimbrial protein n=1 Tax=Serratia TaxID=613 RepID=UPI00217A1BCE|nr:MULTISPECIES: fimbrial protein [Serratia]CAI1103177.1 putative minor fimbrial subunit StfF [Serratia quinivorans]CAI1164039.1 putative minor fimbrial subunit StfF [Serratia quinivorans]CAI1908385.1 putative minor fimbrial subunit StfF [Serratia quinivorans]CAI2143717.1 putative minor fimbrial subunit StfF [Serratia quinivorans]CAI2501813.1 putative minor fimbrial subunit StfF [Serratia quinivorans]